MLLTLSTLSSATLLNSGQFCAVLPKEMPGEEEVAAIPRYVMEWKITTALDRVVSSSDMNGKDDK